MKLNRFILITAAFAQILLSHGSFAAEYQSPRILALGGAGRALPTLNDAIYLNPAYASLSPLYSMSVGYRWFDMGRNYNVSIQDARTEMFQAGVGFTRREQNAAINFGAAKRAMENLGFGAGFKILIDDGTHHMTTDTIFGSEFIATPWYYSGLVIDNIFQSSQSVSHELYRTFYLANRFEIAKVIQVYLDPHYSPSYPMTKAGFAAGLELSLMADFQLRLGKFMNTPQPHINSRGDGFGIGVGWLGPKISVEYAFQKVTSSDISLPVVTSNAVQVNIYF